MNHQLAKEVVDALENASVKTAVFCSGARAYPLFLELKKRASIQLYTFPEERSAAFFALGQAKKKLEPVAVITTSGTAAGELLPAAMEAYYSGIPLLLITCDRERRYRGTGAPQTAEQVGLFRSFVDFERDLSFGETLDLMPWKRKSPAHLNICFEDPLRKSSKPLKGTMKNPVMIVSRLEENVRDEVANYLLKIGAPAIIEGTSGLREDLRLAHLRVYQEHNLLERAKFAGYPIDCVIRIGGVPTTSFFRGVNVPVLSWSSLPFTGIPHGRCVDELPMIFPRSSPENFLKEEQENSLEILKLFEKFPQAEPSFVHALSKQIPEMSFIYLGNSQPIRHWDLAATYEVVHRDVNASRGLNGIDGQLSTFFGMCKKSVPNYAIVGDLTALYDLAAPWIVPQLDLDHFTIVVINNFGGGIFSRFFPEKEFQNFHRLRYSSISQFWGLEEGSQFVELIPCEKETEAFWESYKRLPCTVS